MYGASAIGPMQVPQQIASAFARPELAEMPEIKDATPGTLRLEGTLAKRLPSMPSGDLNDLSFSNSRQVEAQEMMNDMRAAYAISRGYDKRSKAISKAKARQNDRQIKNQESQGRINRRKAQGQSIRQEKSRILRYARDYLGMGTDLYR
jgi:hypothetical protein